MGDNDPRDACNGHGTHVAGIVGANDVEKKFTGVAPDAIFGAYRIFGCSGSSADDVIMKAMEQAYEDGMDVINLSLGDMGWPDSPASVLADDLSMRGMIVIAAAGNEGEKGMFEVGAPSLGRHAVSVASVDNSHVLAHTIRLASGKTIGYATSNGKPFSIPEAPIAPMTLEFGSTSDGCLPSRINMQGMVALVSRGGCVFGQKIKNAQNAGAIAVLVYNSSPGFLTPSAQDPTITIPFGGITNLDGKFLFDQAMNNDKLYGATFEAGDTSFITPTSGKISSFSSWGLGPDLSIKPDISAPGGLIYSTYPMPMGSYATLSGTSMASPFVTGLVAMMQQARGGGRSISAEDLRTRLLNNGHLVTHLEDEKMFESVARQGAGLVDVYQAITSMTDILPEYLELRDLAHAAPDNQYTLQVTNKDRMQIEYSLSHVPAATVQAYGDKRPHAPLSKPIRLAVDQGVASVSFPTTTFILKPNDSINITVQIDPPSSIGLSAPSIYSGYIQIRKDTVDQAMFVPYAGFSTNLGALPVLLMNDTMPFVMNAVINPLDMVRNAGMISLQMIQSSPVVSVTVVDAENTDVTLGWVPGGYTQYVSRNDLFDPEDVFILKWYGNVVETKEQAMNPMGTSNGQFHPFRLTTKASHTRKMRVMDDEVEDQDDQLLIADGKFPHELVGRLLPAGIYRLKISALHVYGDESNPADYDIWISSGITVV
ncbi:subtilisin-like protein [Hesseltinella vesiculosa]|uniref:Subtilisin-like protein n=1 Tax=Hesseltinella vesiculosa TaxID=101127 RepID=A0A1X2GJD4_9FUNG|nr:subtilisin-like protein [Hesseltinella vesiculosa]